MTKERASGALTTESTSSLEEERKKIVKEMSSFQSSKSNHEGCEQYVDLMKRVTELLKSLDSASLPTEQTHEILSSLLPVD